MFNSTNFAPVETTRPLRPVPSIDNILAQAEAVLAVDKAYPVIYHKLANARRYDEMRDFFAEFDAAANCFEQQIVTERWLKI